MRVAAVLVTHNRPQLLLQALAALRAQTRPLDAIYVVDNASDPPCMPATIGAAGNGADSNGAAGSGAAGTPGATGTSGAAGAARRHPVTLLRSDTNLGGAGGFALGMTHAFADGHDWIWLLDDDAMARPDALAQLLDVVAGTDARIGALCGTVREFGDIALRHRRRYHLPSAIELPLPRAAYDGPPCRVDTASFVGFLVAAASIAEVGMPERGFFLGYDDTEYALRLGRAGRSVWLVPASVVEHLRARRARLRAGPFGPKHYFTIRNRIAVARAYATLPVVPTVVTLLFGLALWGASGGRLRRGAVAILLRAIGDGLHGRLGPFPETLARLPTRPAGPHRGTADPPRAATGPAQAMTGPSQDPADIGPGRA
ncbi:glycosyltransferase [Herbaspirillum sp. SJZ107]|uniref:glycosyltransferase n=1 Tax=Herbaspirillum sp. SJZ107 TaxID=2572881 RepID=UPI00115131FC|nr:glycosyltransferase [Herbaspirillum sp. SJZ107]TQK05123.1 GT2 family glycosyltransferase [Herbaspirillum sp. SJZ107]